MMRLWTKVWIAVAVVCVGLTVYELPNISRVGRFSWSMWIWSSKSTPSGKLSVPAILTDRLIATDPEAGDMLRYCLEYSWEDPNLEALASLAERWPQNEFFLSQLAEELTGDTLFDSKAALVLIDRLLTLNPDNAHYRYLRGGILLTDPNCSDRPQAALEQFELGHRLPQFYLPYSKYKARLDRLSEKVTIIRFLERLRIESFYTGLARQLFRPGRFRERLDEATFHDLSASAVRIGDRIIENAHDPETLRIGATLLGSGEGIRLKYLDLPEAEAHQSRLRAARGLALMDIYRQLFGSGMNMFPNVVFMVMVPAILFWTLMFFLLGIVMDFIQACSRRSKPRAKPPVRKFTKAYRLIDIGLFFILVLLVVLEFLKKRPEGELPLFLLFTTALLTSLGAMGLSDYLPVAHLRRFRLWVATLCGSLWFKGAVFWTAGSLSMAMPDHLGDWLPYIGILLIWSVLCVLIWTEAVYRPGVFKAKRWNGVALMTYWIFILMIFYVFGLASIPMERLVTNALAQYHPLPQATQETYNRFILGQKHDQTASKSDPHPDIPGRIEYSAPNDLKAFIAERKVSGKSIPDYQLYELLLNCNRDLRNILLDEIADPNAYELLEIRAEWGDRAVKEQLEHIYQERLAVFRESESEPSPYDPSSLGELLDLAGTLARISDGPEGQQRLSFYLDCVVEKTRSLGTGPKLTDPRHAERIMHPFWWALGELSGDHATPLVKSYLRRTRFVNLFGDRGQDIRQLAALLADGDRELAEEVVVVLAGLPGEETPPNEPVATSGYTPRMRLARHRDKNSPYCLGAVFAHLSVESIPLLLEHLDSDNDQLRAFIVWRVTSLGYEWPRDRLRELLKDSYWKVRLNALFALDTDDLTNALDDENAVVRIIAQMLRQAQPS